MDILNPGVFVRLAFFIRVEKWENMATQMGKCMDYVVNLFTSHFLSAFFCTKDGLWFFSGHKKNNKMPKCSIHCAIKSSHNWRVSSWRWPNRIWLPTPGDGEEQRSVGCLPDAFHSKELVQWGLNWDPKCHGNLQEISWKKCQRQEIRACLVPSKNWRLEWRLEWNIRWSACVKKIVYIIHPFWWFGIWSKSRFSMFCFDFEALWVLLAMKRWL